MKVRTDFKLKRYSRRSFKKMGENFIIKIKNLLIRKKPSRSTFLKRDIHQKSFTNPYKKNRRDSRTIFRYLGQNRFLIAKLLLFIILLFWFYLMFIKPTFYISRIKIDGNKEISAEELSNLVDNHLNKRSLLLVKKSHRFLLDLDKLKETINDRYSLEFIEFTPHWPSNSMSIQIKEKISVFTYAVNENFYAIDRQGLIIRQLAADDEIIKNKEIPMIFQYDSIPNIHIGQQMLNEKQIDAFLYLHNELKKYSHISIHSYRLRISPKKEIKISNKKPSLQKVDAKEELSQDLNDLAQSIVKANTLEDKISNIKQALTDIDLEKIEEGKFAPIYEIEQIYQPRDQYQFQELEVYMNQGWSLKLGSQPLNNQENMIRALEIFATLNTKLDIQGEVREYIDLRFNNRVYYR